MRENLRPLKVKPMSQMTFEPSAFPVKAQDGSPSSPFGTPTSRASQSRRTRLANSPFRQRRFASSGGSPSAFSPRTPEVKGTLRMQPVSPASPSSSTQDSPSSKRSISPDKERSGGVSVRERRRMLLARQNRTVDKIGTPTSSPKSFVGSPSSFKRTSQDPVPQSPRNGRAKASDSMRDEAEQSNPRRSSEAPSNGAATALSPLVNSPSSRGPTTSVNDARRISPTGSARYQRKNRVRAAVVTSPTSPTNASQEVRPPLSPTEDDPSVSSRRSKTSSPGMSDSQGMTSAVESAPPVDPPVSSPTYPKPLHSADTDSSLFSITTGSVTGSASLVDSAGGGGPSTLTDNSSHSKSQRQKSRGGNRRESGGRNSPRSTDGSFQDSLAYSASVVSGSSMGGTSSNYRRQRPHSLSLASGGRSTLPEMSSVPGDDDSNTMFNSIGTGTLPSVEQDDSQNPGPGGSGLSIESSSRDSFADHRAVHPASTPRMTASNKTSARVPPNNANSSTVVTRRVVPLKGGPDEAAGFPAAPPPAPVVQPWDPHVLKKKMEIQGNVRADDDGSGSYRSGSIGQSGVRGQPHSSAASYDSNDNSTHIMYGEGDDGSAQYGPGRGGRRRGRPGVSADRNGIRTFDPLGSTAYAVDAAGQPLKGSTSYPGMTSQTHLSRFGGRYASAGGTVTDEEVSLHSGTIASLSEHGSRVGSVRGDGANGGDGLQPDLNVINRDKEIATATGMEWAINGDDLEHFRKSIDRPVVQAAVGVGAAAALGAILLGPVGLLVGAASVGIGVGVMQIPEEQRSNLANKASSAMKKVHQSAEATGETMSYACVGACERSGLSETIPSELNPCVQGGKDSNGGGGKQMGSRGLFATGSDDSGGSMGPDKRTGDINTRGEFSMGHGDARRYNSDPRNDQHRLSHHGHGGDRHVACLRQGMITPVDQIHALKPSRQPRAWLDVMASASTTRDEKNEAMQEILILAKDKNHSRTLLEEGILDSLMWILTEFFAKYATEYHEQLHDAAAIAAGGGMVPLASLNDDGSVVHAQLAATCCVALGKAHCAVVHTEGDLLLMSSYSRGTVPEERQLAQMLYEVPHHMCVTTTATTSAAEVAAGGFGRNNRMSLSTLTDGVLRASGTAQQEVTGNEVFTLTEMSMQQAEELAKSIKALADGVIVM